MKNQRKNKKITTNSLTRVPKRLAKNTKGTRLDMKIFVLVNMRHQGHQEIYKGCCRH
jgi:hypothetical protein